MSSRNARDFSQVWQWLIANGNVNQQLLMNKNLGLKVNQPARVA
jgi:hypothetical protein